MHTTSLHLNSPAFQHKIDHHRARIMDHTIGVVCGGFSREREISLRTGRNVLAALIRRGYNAHLVDIRDDALTSFPYDIAFNALHGPFGEDGAIQALWDLKKIPYTGAGVRASVIGMNKYLTKTVCLQNELTTPSFQLITDASTPLRLTGPVVLKPVSEGSSVGVHFCDSHEDYRAVIDGLLAQYGTLLAETCIQGQEVTVSVLEAMGQICLLPILELRPLDQYRFYDYEAKYTKGATQFILPAQVSEACSSKMQEMARALHNAIGCRTYSRVDMMVDRSQTPYILEINTLPGMTETSDLPAQAAAAGVPFDTLVELILFDAQYDRTNTPADSGANDQTNGKTENHADAHPADDHDHRPENSAKNPTDKITDTYIAPPLSPPIVPCLDT